MSLKELVSQIEDSLVRSFPAHDTIVYQGEIPRSAFVIKSGVVKIFSISKNGDEQIVNFSVEGEFLPAAWVAGKATSSLYYYQALTDCEVYELPRERLAELFRHPAYCVQVLDWMSGMYLATLIRVTALEQARARDKLLYTFYFLLHRYGKEVVPGWYGISIKLTHQMIADLVGLTRETTAVELGNIRKEKVLSYKRQKYLIHRERLLQLIGEESFASLKL